MAEFRPEALNGFRDAAQSLKLYRRAELSDEGGSSLIEDPCIEVHLVHARPQQNHQRRSSVFGRGPGHSLNEPLASHGG
jgi:hypothetical protein